MPSNRGMWRLARSREVELKFTIDPREADRLFRHPLLVSSPQRRSTVHLVSTYFDTPDAYLRRHNVSLRVRRSGTRLVETVKWGVDAIDRDEWEHDGAPEPNVAWLKTTPIWPLMKKGEVPGRLAPRFTIDVERAKVLIDHGGAQIEGALDHGTIRAGGLTSPVSEFELELLSGGLRNVFALSRRLARDLPLHLRLASKSDQGHAVADLTWGHPVKALDVDLSGIRTIAGSFRITMQAALDALLMNAALIENDDDAEAVHRSRVALRRLRALLDLFRPVLRAKRARHLREELAWASGKFGEARDADVFRASLESAEADGAGVLRDALGDAHREAHAKLRKALASTRWRLLCLDLLHLSVVGIRKSRRNARYRLFVRRELHRRYRRLAGSMRQLRKQPIEDLHEVRKSAKMLRYDIEFFEGVKTLGRTRKARRLVVDLEALQDALGLLHDGHVRHERLRRVADEGQRPVTVSAAGWTKAAFAAGQIVAAAPDEATLRTRAAKAGRRIRKAQPFG